MDIFIIIFMIILLIGLRPTKNNPDYINRDTTTSIKGIFAVIILFSHSRQYFNTSQQITLPDIAIYNYDHLFNSMLNFTGQLMVVMFLIYSGYGIMESYKRDKEKYLNTFFKKRLLKTLLHFDMAVLLFWIVARIYDHEYSNKEIVLSLTGWSSIGNSNWFVFDILMLYIITYICLNLATRFKFNNTRLIALLIGSTSCFLVFMIKAKEIWWWDTILSFPIGIIYSIYKGRIENYLRTPKNYLLALTSGTLLFLIFYYLGTEVKTIFSTITSVLFAILVIMLTMKIKIGNKILYWLGVNAFSIYILQRIPMIIANEYGINDNPVIFFSIVAPCVLVLAYFFTRTTNLIDKKLF